MLTWLVIIGADAFVVICCDKWSSVWGECIRICRSGFSVLYLS